ncbi:protein kinase domain-containing protein [Rubritalea tangerina]|uniref:Protein kinase n=1 Tax=Rubritalea tangerina TaxID=430798 RepID=A0ABW4ZCY8_9BACT
MKDTSDTGQRYTIKSILGTGGFGSVYRAYDSKLQRDVAIKRLDKGDCQESIRQKLMDEARVLATLKHPNIVSIYDVSSQEQFDEIVMEFINGITLQTFVKRHLLQANDFRHIAAQVLHALSASHKAGVLHCDIKPENVMLCLTSGDQYELKVFDFGMSEAADNTSANEDFKLVGSVYVMAPELFDRQRPCEKTDIYALGCLFYFLLTGAYPFVGASSMQVMASHLKGKHRPLLAVRPDLGQEFCDWVESFIKTDPNERLESCAKGLEQLLRFEFQDKVGVFTLPTDLEIESENSRVVRTLTRRSLELESAADDKRTTRYLTNTITHSLGITKSAKAILEEAEDLEDPFSPKPKVLPDTAEWFFTRGDEAKGPVTLDQLYRLVEDDKVEAGSMVWHPHYGEWVHAYNCAELKPYFPEAPKEDEEEADELAKEQIETARKLPFWLNPEVLVVLLGGILAAIGAFVFPQSQSMILMAFAAVVAVFGFGFLRVRQYRDGKMWLALGLCLPVIGDLIYAIVKRDMRAAVGMTMFLLGGLAVFTFGSVVIADYASDQTMANTEVQSS